MTVSAGVKCYNNVRYIREALESAFRQTWRPLEIVVSDDASVDGSWDVIREVVGSHRGEKGLSVVVSRNESNLGNLGNWERICELATGELVVKFDGDDVSEPERVERIVAAAESARAAGMSPCVVGHGGWMIGPSGRPMGVMRPAARGNHTGAAMAFSRRCFTEFARAECSPRIVDDELYAWRGMMLGDFVEMGDRLVRYRVGTGVSNSLFGVRRPMSRSVHDMLEALDQCERDASKLKDADAWRVRIAAEREQAEARRDLIDGADMCIRLAGARRLRMSGRVWSFLKFAFVLPRILGSPLLFVYALVRFLVRRLGTALYKR